MWVDTTLKTSGFTRAPTGAGKALPGHVPCMPTLGQKHKLQKHIMAIELTELVFKADIVPDLCL